MSFRPKEIDSLKIVTLQDNYIDVLVMDNDQVIQRPFLVIQTPDKRTVLSKSPLAEHGFSAFITVTKDGQEKSMLFDFGGSENGAAYNASLLGVDLTKVEALALSHGHLDHVGGIKKLSEKIEKPGLELVCHPSCFKKDRYIKTPTCHKIFFPAFTGDDVFSADWSLNETKEPEFMLDDTCLFLGEIKRTNDFEKGMQSTFAMDNGEEVPDIIEDDTALAFNVKGKGLVVLSGCAHSGIVNTVNYAKDVTNVDDVFVIMGGFHLTGPGFEPQIPPTIEALKEFAPKYVIPTHCTGRKAIMEIEKNMPDQFILNMCATTLNFSA